MYHSSLRRNFGQQSLGREGQEVRTETSGLQAKSSTVPNGKLWRSVALSLPGSTLSGVWAVLWCGSEGRAWRATVTLETVRKTANGVITDGERTIRRRGFVVRTAGNTSIRPMRQRCALRSTLSSRQRSRPSAAGGVSAPVPPLQASRASWSSEVTCRDGLPRNQPGVGGEADAIILHETYT